jgi:hypothetical protein
MGPWFQTTGFQLFSLSVGGEVRRKPLNPPAFSNDFGHGSYRKFPGVCGWRAKYCAKARLTIAA